MRSGETKTIYRYLDIYTNCEQQATLCIEDFGKWFILCRKDSKMELDEVKSLRFSSKVRHLNKRIILSLAFGASAPT